MRRRTEISSQMDDAALRVAVTLQPMRRIGDV
jgi:hypothetical protein